MSEVQWSGSVTSAPTFFLGTHTHSWHEQFDVARDDGGTFRVIDNVDLAPRIPVVVGDRVNVKGELVDPQGHPPIVHWTHHDPRGTHEGGWIDLDGKRYERAASASRNVTKR